MELIFYAGSSLLEGPIWDATNKLIYCVSIEQGLIYQINPTSGEVQTFITDGSVGCVALTPEGNLMSAEKNGIFIINPKTREKTYVTQFESDINLRYNDGRFDPVGRFLVGTKSEKDYFIEETVVKGKLFSYHNGEYKVLLNDFLEEQKGISRNYNAYKDVSSHFFYWCGKRTHNLPEKGKSSQILGM